jgi:DNA-binding NarL/FixJ family response regulator
LIAAGVRLYREGLATSLASRDHLAVVATSASRVDAHARVLALVPDVVVLDMGTEGSLDLIRELRTAAPNVKILAFAVDEVSSDILECAEAGASGYVTSDASIDELAIAIERIAREELVCSPRIAAKLFGRIWESGERSPSGESEHRTLTSREREVLDLICGGDSNKDIAQKLNIAEATVKNHVHHLLDKLDVATRAQAAARATLPRFRRRALASMGRREIG